MQNFPDHSQLVVSYSPDGFLGSESRAPRQKSPARLTALACHSGPGGLRKRATHHPVAFRRTVADGHAGAFLLTGTDGHPGSELARGFERLGAGSGFCNQVLSGSHTDTRDFTQAFDRLLMRCQGLRQSSIEIDQVLFQSGRSVVATDAGRCGVLP